MGEWSKLQLHRGVEAEGQIEWTSDTQGTEKGWSICTDAPTPSPTSPISVVGMCDADGRCVSSKKFPVNYGTSFFCSITFDVDATLHVVEFETELSCDVLPLEDWVVDVRENPAAQPGWIHQVRWPCEAVYGCSLCSSIPARGAHERCVAAARVRAGSLESSEPFEVSADGQRSRVDPHGTMFVDDNGVTLRGWIDSEDFKLWEPDARVQLAVGNAKVKIEQHTEGRGETSRAMLDLSVSGLTGKVDTIGGWLGVDGSMHAGELPAGCEGAHGSPEDRPRYIMNQMDQGSAEWTLLSSKR